MDQASVDLQMVSLKMMDFKTRIEVKLATALTPAHLEVINESHRHNVPPDAETHFKVIIVSTQFDELPLLARHRKVNELLAAELAEGVHALAIHAYSVPEWEARSSGAPQSPPCLGGEKR